MTREKPETLFDGLPRRRRLAGFVTVALWIGICAAFVTDMVPTRPAADWLYGVEARRDAYARVLAARAAHETGTPGTPGPRRAARAAPAAPQRDRAAPALTPSALQVHAPRAAICQWP